MTKSKRILISFFAFTLVLSAFSGFVPPAQAAVPYISEVYYMNPTTIVVSFTEEMDTSTVTTADFEIKTEISGDIETVSSVTAVSNQEFKVIASQAKISPSYGDYLKVVGSVNSNVGGDAMTDNYPW
ncbi:MAG: hypothetical protein KAS12_04990, partial [Candidatus Aenigmarchaeota archaeon]|nr:hypothetical protein [Candidatus Aenigmarchaeota archaeon]